MLQTPHNTPAIRIEVR